MIVQLSQHSPSEKVAEQERLAMVGQMASGVLHDVKNALGVIRAAAQLVEMTTAEDAGRYTGLICEQTDQLVEMMQDVLTFARGCRDLQLTPVDMPGFLHDLAAAYQPLLQSDGIELVLDVESCRGEFDASQLRRAVANLVANARDAMPQGGLLVLRARREGAQLVVEVEDNGAGMAPEVLERMLEPFYTHGKQHGSGLGTMIVRSVVEAHGGHMQVRSTVGAGTVVSLYLPRLEETGTPDLVVLPGGPQPAVTTGRAVSPTRPDATGRILRPTRRVRAIQGTRSAAQAETARSAPLPANRLRLCSPPAPRLNPSPAVPDSSVDWMASLCDELSPWAAVAWLPKSRAM